MPGRLRAEGRRVLIYSQFTTMLDLIQVDSDGVALRLTGFIRTESKQTQPKLR
jgi:hypothetical protein